MNTIPINTENSPTVILELLYSIKVKNVMTRKIITAAGNDSLKSVQDKMKKNKITGVPVVAEKRLIGIVSMDDIIRALEGGYINEAIENHMTRSLIVLEDDMPISFAISYLDKYRFGRFPVLDKHRALVGIVTSRDIVNYLILEMNRQMTRLEDRILPNNPELDEKGIRKEYISRKFDFEKAGHASTEIRKTLKEHKLDRKLIRRIAVATYELEMNQVVHSEGGKIIFLLDEHKATIRAEDTGPGIPEIDKALSEGFSTANDWIRSLGFGAGMGLPNVKRVSDRFEINSSPEGTKVTAEIDLQG